MLALVLVAALLAAVRDGVHPTAVRRWCAELMERPLAPTCWCPVDAAPGIKGGYAKQTARVDSPSHFVDRWARDSDGRATFNAAEGQDWWLFTQWLPQAMIGQERGSPPTYVDLATNDPVFRNNMYFFDACLGWRGLCVEANPQHHFNIWEHRTCTLVPACASSTRQRLSFRLNSREVTGGSSRIDASGGSGARGARPHATDSRSPAAEVACTTLTGMLERNGWPHVDVMSLDVEGHEAMVLAGLNFSSITVDVIVLEPACVVAPALCATLRNEGYQQVRTPGHIGDYVWAREAFLAAHPALHTSLRRAARDKRKAYACRPGKNSSDCRGFDVVGGGRDYDERSAPV